MVNAKITALHPRFGGEILTAPGQIARYISISVDGEPVLDLSRVLPDGCSVYFYLMFSGG